MAGKKLLSCLKKRDLLNSDKLDGSRLAALGEAYLQENRLSDAIDFFAKAEHLEGLNSLKDRCISEGDFFLFNRLIKILGESPASEGWTRLGDSAVAHGKLHFARSAYRQANQPEKVAQVERLLSSPPHDQANARDVLH